MQFMHVVILLQHAYAVCTIFLDCFRKITFDDSKKFLEKLLHFSGVFYQF